jgi:hypothetical protein
MRSLREGERVMTLYKSVQMKMAELGDLTDRLREAPDALAAEKEALQVQLGSMIAAEEARHSCSLDATSSYYDPKEAALVRAHEEAEKRERHIEQLVADLRAANLEVQASRKQISELQHELAAEQHELHKLRLEARLTLTPTMTAARMPQGHTSPLPPYSRQLEHPELETPRPPSTPSGAASARRPRTAAASREQQQHTPGGSARGAGHSSVHSSARPAAHSHTPAKSAARIGALHGSSMPSTGALGGSCMPGTGTGRVAAGAAAAAALMLDRAPSLMLEVAPDLSAPFSEFAKYYGALGGRHKGGATFTGDAFTGDAFNRDATHSLGRSPAASVLSSRSLAPRDAGVQTDDELLTLRTHADEFGWKERCVELQKANSRLQTALLAAALDGGKDVDLRTALSAVNRTGNVGGPGSTKVLGSAGLGSQPRPHRAGSASARRPTSAGIGYTLDGMPAVPKVVLHEWPPMA